MCIRDSPATIWQCCRIRAWHISTAVSYTHLDVYKRQGYIEHYKKVIKTEEHPHFGALFNDLNGNKTIFALGQIEKYRPLQVVYWILNPTYQKIYETVENNEDLLRLRNDLLSKEFWEYVLTSLRNVVNLGYDYLNIDQEFDSIVRGIFTCGVSSDVKEMLGKVNAELTKIRALD